MFLWYLIRSGRQAAAESLAASVTLTEFNGSVNMEVENISLFELLNLSIGTTQRGSVNFSALYALLLAVLKKLGVLELQTQWKELHPEHSDPHGSVDVSDRDRAPEGEEVLTDTEADPQVLQRRDDSGASDPDGDERLRSRIQTCEDGLSKVEVSFLKVIKMCF